MSWDVTEVCSVAPRDLEMRFEDGLVGILHIDPGYCTGVFEALKDDALVARAEAMDGAVTWPNGLDLAPDTMYREIKASADRRYVVGRMRLAA